jgi:hypothetical protein
MSLELKRVVKADMWSLEANINVWGKQTVCTEQSLGLNKL